MYKVRLVVKGFSKKKCIDFEETFSPMVKMSSIRVVLGLAARFTNADMVGDVDSRKAEYIAIIEARKELLWMKKFLQELGLQSKYIDVRYHWIRDALEMKLFFLDKIHIDENGSDMMTNPIPIEKLQFYRKQLGLVEALT
ncbi:Retrovirus-related Pol polyprotein from transposon TNT 1-94 [Vitis vinifera]|uniref:Retrovirus-related Pol polyprotein from transposon TNT 1-94 n=1 Tax=Vitis vinifera TaxID=29760 RepID=A0A438HGY6_VITVI|nr:Retrovirus-related Pol polyprotein from transposon TNT 1-94 [Vitis vinifera]